MSQEYSDPRLESDPHALPDVEIFYADIHDIKDWNDNSTEGESYTEPGWYFWSCFPGCLPESDPIGPFETEQQAKEEMLQMFAPDDYWEEIEDE